MVKLTLAAARVNRGYTQAAAAQELGIAKETLSKWESGKTMPNTKYLPRICELYGVGIDDLIFYP